MPYFPQAFPAQPPYGYNPRNVAVAAPAARAQTKPPVVRGQIPDNAPAPLTMPTPEEVGIRFGSAPSALDWDQLRTQLDRLGVRDFQLDKHGSGYRFACRLPSGPVDGIGTSEVEAVKVAMAKIQK
jgi:hypothetical protein